MSTKLLESLHLKGFLSFGPQSSEIRLDNLNVLIGPNGVGKSNFIEALELLHAAPTNFASAVRLGGLPSNWIWHGRGAAACARLEARLVAAEAIPELRYIIEFMQVADRLEITDEILEDAPADKAQTGDVRFYYRLHGQGGLPTINVRQPPVGTSNAATYAARTVGVNPQQSALSQLKDPISFPEFSAVTRRLGNIQLFREWGFGRSSALRVPQPGDLPADVLLPQLTNLGLVLNELEQRGALWNRFNELLNRFFPRFQRLTIKVAGGAVQIFLHEDGLGVPVPAARLSDGTLRSLCLLAILLSASSASLICIEEPELGMHPDAMHIVAELLVEAARQTQLVVTTHSDALVSDLTEHAEAVLVCDYLKNGTELRRLEAAKLAHWLGEYRLGDIWRAGKLGGNP